MKKNKFTAVALIATALTLTSCSSTIYPGLDHENITISGDEYFTSDNLDYIYEKLHDASTTGEEVRDIIISNYTLGYIGDYRLIDGEIKLIGFDVTDETGTTETTEAQKFEFIQNHEIYHDKDLNGDYIAPDQANLANYTNRIQIFKDIILDNTITTLFTEANSDSYKADNYFNEVLYARSKFPDYQIADFDPSFTDGKNIYDKEWESEIVWDNEQGHYELPSADFPFTNGILIDSTISTENIDSIVGTDNSTGLPMLHINLYEEYINKEIIPDILNNLLVEQYIYDNQYTTLSRTQARKINYVAITTTSDNINAARRLINAYIDEVIVKSLEPYQTLNEENALTETEEYQPLNFDVLSDAWKGIYDDDPSFDATLVEERAPIKEAEGTYKYVTGNELYEQARFTKITTHADAINSRDGSTSYIDGKEHTYYENTQYGALMENFALMNNDRNDASSNSQWSSFTNSGEYTYEHGLELQTNEIRIDDYTGYLVGTSSSGFSDLPTAITDSLFEYSVSLDTPEDRTQFNSRNSDYVTMVNGRYFLKRATSLSTNIHDQIVIPDSDSSTFYIVEIEYALNQNKMTPREGQDAANFEIEQTAREIGYTLASGDTYQNTAYLYYLENCGIEYNDQSIYDYMLATYPDLFDDSED